MKKKCLFKHLNGIMMVINVYKTNRGLSFVLCTKVTHSQSISVENYLEAVRYERFQAVG